MPNQSYVAAKMFKAVLADTDAICKAQTVGAGGGNYSAGSPSVFSTITSAGGGRGGK